MKTWLTAGVLGLVLTAAASGQLVFSAPTGGGASGLFQQSAGSVSPISSGLADNGFPSISRDGRLVIVSGPDPAQPSQPSTDLWLIDRVARSVVKLVNHSSPNLPDGSIATVNPHHSALSLDHLTVVVTDQILITSASGNSVTPQLNIYRVSDGFPLDLVEMGRGDFSDLFRSEFVGISWKPDGSGFATPAYATFPTQSGSVRDLVGIILYSYDPFSGTAARQAVLSQPRSYDLMMNLPSETHILPVFSPNGSRLAYFEIFWPNPLLTQPATATLMTANANGSSVVRLLTFTAGLFPLGLTWSADGSRLIFSIANQVNAGGTFVAQGDRSTGRIRSIDSITGGTPTMLPGVDSGYYPNYPAFSIVNQTSLTLAPFGPDTLLLRAPGLPGSAVFGLQSTIDMMNFGPRQNFTGAEFNNGIVVTPGSDTFRTFRLLE